MAELLSKGVGQTTIRLGALILESSRPGSFLLICGTVRSSFALSPEQIARFDEEGFFAIHGLAAPAEIARVPAIGRALGRFVGSVQRMAEKLIRGKA